MKNYKLTLLLTCLCFPFALISQIQGDGSLPKTYKTNNNYKTIDTWVFSTPDLVALKQEDDLYDNIGDRPWRFGHNNYCLLYTSPSPRDRTRSRMPSSA